MKLKVYIANAFTDQRFGGNPAAVVPLKEWLDDALMQQIAGQNNLSETAFIVPLGENFEIRWFTPTVEVSLCGHATLAAAHVFFKHLDYPKDRIVFQSESGPLRVSTGHDRITLDFPAKPPVKTARDPLIERALGITGAPVYTSAFDYMLVLETQSQIEGLHPDFNLLKTHPSRGLIVTARGDQADFVSRCFYPQSGINEDPVTGSAHVVMVPYWASVTGKTTFSAIQLSQRRGFLDCTLSGDRVLMSGQAVTYLEGEFNY